MPTISMGYWKLGMTIPHEKLSQETLNHMAELIKDGFQEGQIFEVYDDTKRSAEE